MSSVSTSVSLPADATSAGPPREHGLGYAVPSTEKVKRSARALLIDRYTPPAFITLILLVANWQYGVLENPWYTALAIATAIACEVIFGRLITGKVPHLASAYITGISVGILIRSGAYWPYALCSAISIVSKYALRLDNRHLWNPSNFGVSMVLLLAPWAAASLGQQWGNNLAPVLVIWCLGFIIVYRVGRLHVSVTYVLSFLLFSVVRHWVTGQPWLAEVAPITGPMYQLFTFFMVTDPRTTVKPRWAQCVVVFCVAAVEAVLRLNEVVHAPYYALCMVGPTALLIETLINRRSRARASRNDTATTAPAVTASDALP